MRFAAFIRGLILIRERRNGGRCFEGKDREEIIGHRLCKNALVTLELKKSSRAPYSRINNSLISTLHDLRISIKSSPQFPPVNNPHKIAIMSSMFGFGRPQPSSAEKIAAAEQEMDLVTDMFNKLEIFPYN